MASKTRCAGIGVPVAMNVRHKTARMRFWIRPFDAIRVDVTLHTDRVRSLDVVARLAAFYFAARKPGMLSAAGPHAYRDKSRCLV